MPVVHHVDSHRVKSSCDILPFSACVARPVTKTEVARTPAAQAALQKEWDRLRAAGCWNESVVREWSHVAAEARDSGQSAHMGRIFAICVEKGSELAPGDPARKFKGRVVFQGNNVRDQNWDAAMFQELGSAPASMQASKTADAYGLCAGHSLQQADAVQAYIQAKLTGPVKTWVLLPSDQWPKGWAGKYKCPVVPLMLALYGHPDSGGMWERNCGQRLRMIGYVPIPEWRSCFWHEAHKLLLIVYVDDFKLVGPEKSLVQAWSEIRKHINIEDPTPIGQYLGCEHVPMKIHTSSMHPHVIPMFAYPRSLAVCLVPRGATAAGIPAPGGSSEQEKNRTSEIPSEDNHDTTGRKNGRNRSWHQMGYVWVS